MPIFGVSTRYADWANVPVFIESHLEECRSGRITASEIYERYAAWCDFVDAYAKQAPVVFGRIASEMGIQKHKSGRVYCVGVKWRDRPADIPDEIMAEHVLRPTMAMHAARRHVERVERESSRAAKRQERTEAIREAEEEERKAYYARIDASVNGWASDRLVKSDGVKVMVKFWYSDYVDWCDENEHQNVEANGLTAALLRLGYPVSGVGLSGMCVGFDVPI